MYTQPTRYVPTGPGIHGKFQPGKILIDFFTLSRSLFKPSYVPTGAVVVYLIGNVITGLISPKARLSSSVLVRGYYKVG